MCIPNLVFYGAARALASLIIAGEALHSHPPNSYNVVRHGSAALRKHRGRWSLLHVLLFS